MFNVYKRGPASISTISRAFRAVPTTLRAPSVRPSTLSLSFQSSSRPLQEAQFLHVSSQLQARWGGGSGERAVDEAHETPKNSAFPTITEFDDLATNKLVHPNVVDAITLGMGHKTMTEVQSKTINQALQGTDIIAQARTGTGKTIGFLLPTIQNILAKSPELATRTRYSRARSSDIRAIIISPTRELAEQIGKEAERLCGNTDLRVQVAVGGNHKALMLRKTQREGCHLLVATPGRLNDLLTDKYSGIRAPNLSTLVLDEADRLLDDGFSRDVEDIIDLLPKRNEVDRQTLLFSATVPREVMGLVRQTLKPDYQFVQTVGKDDLETHERVPQKLVIVPGLENTIPALYELSKREIEKAVSIQKAGGVARPFKAIVYFSSTANVELSAQIFENLKSEKGVGQFGQHPLYPAEILEMHGQLTQQQRTRVSDRFRRAESAILFSTDVTARGMDFPNVTHVIQIGLPPNRDQYIHRIGRTGRAGKEGEGWLILAKSDVRDAKYRLTKLPFQNDESLEAAKVDMTRDAQLPASIASILSAVGDATKMVDRQTKTAAYMAALGQATGAKYALPILNQWTRYGWGWPEPPAISQRLAQKLGVARVPGINIQHSSPSSFATEFEDTLNGIERPRAGRLDRNQRRDGGGFGGRSGGFSDRGRGFNDRRRDRGGYGTDSRGDGPFDRKSGGGYGGRDSRSDRSGGFDFGNQNAVRW